MISLPSPQYFLLTSILLSGVSLPTILRLHPHLLYLSLMISPAF